MFQLFVLAICLVSWASADDPILHLYSTCPTTSGGKPTLRMKADVPAYAIAICKNNKIPMKSSNFVDFNLIATLDRKGVPDDVCQFYKKSGVNTYTVDVEVGWGEKDSQVINHVDVKTISCAYDEHGNAESESETISDWFLAPYEVQNLVAGKSKATFDLQIVDVLGEVIKSDHIHIGRKIRIRATDKSDKLDGFRAISCVAKNAVSTYPILRAGCGDGLVFSRSAGFQTRGAEVNSPYFDAFKLQGANDIQFQCNFTACSSNCDGDSCATESRKRRSLSAESYMYAEPLMASTNLEKHH